MVTPIDVHQLSGLSQTEARARLRKDGPNELPRSRRGGIAGTALEILREPMILLLIAAAGIYALLGDLHEAVVLGCAVAAVLGIEFYQQRKTDRALEALRDLSSPRALVIRDGQRRRIPGREVVRGDLIVLAEGDRVPADAVLLRAVNFSTDESLLTGESVPVRKRAAEGTEAMARPGGDDLPFVYSGTLAVSGTGVARVEATGTRTEMGRIGRALEELEPERTRLHLEVRRLVKVMAIAGMALCALVAVLYGLLRGSWLNGLLAGIALAIAMVPEEFPVVLTVFLALGAWRMSRHQVLTRQLGALEVLGAATVLCVDKTGTLTQNRMAVACVDAHGKFYKLNGAAADKAPDQFDEIVEYSILASRRDPFDPMEMAFKQFGERYLDDSDLHPNWSLVREYPLAPPMLALTRVWEPAGGGTYVVAAKGAPESIARLCRFDPGQIEGVTRRATVMANDGLRVLGVARAEHPRGSLPADPSAFRFEFVGLVGLADPIRPDVPAAVTECHGAGIRVVMITGDFPATARSIARQIGLERADEVMTGPEIESLSEEKLSEAAKRTNVFARVAPEQKLRLVNALKAAGEVVAMTGDGVNDAPALKAAQIGIAMGGRGTDVAREAADLVLVDDEFSSLVQGIRMGRRVFDNLKKAMAFAFAIHVPIAVVSLVPVLLGLPLILFPVHIVFMEFITDPACSIAFEAEPEEADVMTRPPRDPREPLFSRTIGLSLLQGASVAALVMAVFALALHYGRSQGEARALTVTSLVMGDLGLVLINRSWTRTFWGTLGQRNPVLWWLFAWTAVILCLILYVPFLRRVFSFDWISPGDLLLCIGAAVVALAWFEALKLVRAFRQRRRSPGEPARA